MTRSITAGRIHTQFRFPVAPGVTVHKGHLYGFDAAGHLVAVADAESGRRIVQAMEKVTGDAIASKRALCAVSVIVLIPAATLSESARGRRVFAVDSQSAGTTDNGKPCGVLLDVEGTTAAILLS